MPPQKPQKPRASLPPLPPAANNSQASRAFGADADALVARVRELTIATREATGLARRPFALEAEADGVKISASRIGRYEKMTERAEIDLFAVLWLMAAGGYTWQDVYPPLAGAGRLSEDEAELLRVYRAAQPFARPSIIQYAGLMARDSAERAALPANVRTLPRPAAHPDDGLARDQASHEAHMAEQEMLDAVELRRQRPGRGTRHPRKFYGTHGANGKSGG